MLFSNMRTRIRFVGFTSAREGIVSEHSLSPGRVFEMSKNSDLEDQHSGAKRPPHEGDSASETSKQDVKPVNADDLVRPESIPVNETDLFPVRAIKRRLLSKMYPILCCPARCYAVPQ